MHAGAIVTFGHELPGKDVVVQDYGPGTRELMDHLIGLGHTRIGFIHGVTRGRAWPPTAFSPTAARSELRACPTRSS